MIGGCGVSEGLGGRMNDQKTTERGSPFFRKGATIIASLVLLSFPLTYYIPLATGTKAFTLLRHLHGLAFFAWIGLYVAQTRLVSQGNVRQHRELGLAGVALAGAMVPLGLWQTVTSAGERGLAGMALPFEFSIYNLVDITVFAVAFGWGAFEALKRIEWHRRLMFIAALNLFGPAFSRIIFLLPVEYPISDMLPNLVADFGLVLLALHDRRKTGRVHPVTFGAALVLVPLHIVEPFLARSDIWNSMAPTLFGFG